MDNTGMRNRPALQFLIATIRSDELRVRSGRSNFFCQWSSEE